MYCVALPVSLTWEVSIAAGTGDDGPFALDGAGAKARVSISTIHGPVACFAQLIAHHSWPSLPRAARSLPLPHRLRLASKPAPVPRIAERPLHIPHAVAAGVDRQVGVAKDVEGRAAVPHVVVELAAAHDLAHRSEAGVELRPRDKVREAQHCHTAPSV